MSTHKAPHTLFDRSTQAIIYGLQSNAIQRMLDFDDACRRETPSVAAIVNENKAGWHKVFWREKELLLPMYRGIERACEHHPNADVLINFASFRSAYPTTLSALEQPSLRTVVVIAEGMPERYARAIRHRALSLGKTVIGPATVGGIAAGAFKVGNTGGSIDNIIASKLHRPGHVAFVSKSGGMSNEAYNIIARNTDGLYEGIAIGGDSFPGSTLFEHVMRYEANPEVHMIVVLGEVGGEAEYEIAKALREGKLSKPVVAWVTGTCARIFPRSIQFGHAGARADAERETAAAKNEALRAAGALVPSSFDDFDAVIRECFQRLQAQGQVPAVDDFEARPTPLGFKEAVAQHVVRRKTNFTTTISDERGDEPLYAGVPLSKLVAEPNAIGEAVGLLWFKRLLPEYARRFIELTMVLVADHGPAVSGAHNTIVAARAGKDLVSSLAAGLLTIGPRFGGAISGAAQMFKEGIDRGLSPEGFVRLWKERGANIQGIGHKVKSIHNPDVRVSQLIGFAREHFPSTRHLDFALAVEAATTKKRDNLILNVDGCIGVLFLDIMDGLGFSAKEVDDIVLNGGLDGLFIIGRCIGLIGHFFDQKRLLEPLYRHPTDDILYALPRPDEL